MTPSPIEQLRKLHNAYYHWQSTATAESMRAFCHTACDTDLTAIIAEMKRLDHARQIVVSIWSEAKNYVNDQAITLLGNRNDDPPLNISTAIGSAFSSLKKELDSVCAEMERLKAIVEKLQTADGAPIDPDQPLWSCVPAGEISMSGEFGQTGMAVGVRPIPARHLSLHGIITNGYSTREAAEEAARKAKP